MPHTCSRRVRRGVQRSPCSRSIVEDQIYSAPGEPETSSITMPSVKTSPAVEMHSSRPFTVADLVFVLLFKTTSLLAHNAHATCRPLPPKNRLNFTWAQIGKSRIPFWLVFAVANGVVQQFCAQIAKGSTVWSSPGTHKNAAEKRSRHTSSCRSIVHQKRYLKTALLQFFFGLL